LSRIIHRILAFFAVLLMLWLASTGSSMQVIDLMALLAHTPQSDPTQLSIVEGMYGQPNFAVVQVADFSADSLPKDLDPVKALATVLEAAQLGKPALRVQWVELRVVEHRTIGQIEDGEKLRAFDALTGEEVAAVPPQPIPQGRRLPPSPRQTLKQLHRFWSRGEMPGVFVEVVVGLVLWTLLITGLVMYFKLLAARARIGRRQWFWLTGGVWRGLHRSVSILAAAFLLCMAFSGTWIGLESSWSALWGRQLNATPAPVALLQRAEMPQMMTTTLDAVRREHPDAAMKVIRLRTFGTMKQGVVVSAAEPPDQWVFDATSGRSAGLTEAAYPRTNFPFGVQIHEDMKHFHSGAMFGLPARLMNLFAGLSLLFLSISGSIVYLDLLGRRRKTGRQALVWTR
jgi:uncharacterized iron-regulated membrane protein